MTRTCRYEMRRYSAIRNAAAPRVGGDSSAPMPEAASMAPAVSASKPTRRITGQATDPSVTVVATPLPETVPSRKPASVTDRPADRFGLPRRENDIAKFEEERAGARSLEHGAVDAEQNDVGDGDVERHAVDALERHVEIADEPRQVVAAMREAGETDRAPATVRRSAYARNAAAETGRIQPVARRAASRTTRMATTPASDVAAGRIRGAIEKRLALRERPAESEQRRDNPRRIDRRTESPLRRRRAQIAHTPISSISGR